MKKLQSAAKLRVSFKKDTLEDTDSETDGSKAQSITIKNESCDLNLGYLEIKSKYRIELKVKGILYEEWQLVNETNFIQLVSCTTIENGA